MYPKTLHQRKIRGAGNRGACESMRLQQLQKCIIQANIQQSVKTAPQPFPCITQPVIQQTTTPNQLTFILNKAVACPILYVTPVTTFGCQPTYTETIPPLQGHSDLLGETVVVSPPQGPAVSNVYRKFSRIGGIDEISKPLTTVAGSAYTARKRAGIVSQSQTRYVQTLLPIIGYPPCVSPRVGPAAGVPIAPNTGCNNGARRVDFSNPIA
jgi:hypothetical protein